MGASIQEINIDREFQFPTLVPIISTIEDMEEILTPQKDLGGVMIETLKEGRRSLEMDMGEGKLRVVEIPGRRMTQEEWSIIQSARESYFLMWGGNSASDAIKEDPFDGLGKNSQYITHHYIGQVVIPEAKPRYITMRRVKLNPKSIGEFNPPDDGSFWQVTDKNTGDRKSLWSYIVDSGISPFNIAAISRTGTCPYRAKGKTLIERERNAIAFAGIQILATENSASDYFVCQLCEEFQTDVLSIQDKNGNKVKLDFARTEDTLNLSPESELKLDIQNPRVRQVKALFPGYWVDGKGAAQVIDQLLMSNCLSATDLEEALLRASKEFPNIRSRAVNNGLIRTLTEPLYFKYLIPLIKDNMQLRELLVDSVKERPFSSTLIPDNWRESALKLLAAACERYKL